MNASGPPRTAAGTPYDPRAARAVIIVLAVMALMVTYVETMVLPAFKAFITFFDNAPTTTVVWIVSAYLLIGTVATPIFGKLGDKYGKKRMLVFVMGLYAVVVSIAGFTPDIGSALGVSRANQIYLLIGVRAIQGLGMGMFPLAFAMLPEVFPAARVGQAQGVIGGMFASGAALGLVGGGYIAYNFGWQLTYHTVTPIAILLVILAYVVLRESPNLSPKPIDIPAASPPSASRSPSSCWGSPKGSIGAGRASPPSRSGAFRGGSRSSSSSPSPRPPSSSTGSRGLLRPWSRSRPSRSGTSGSRT